MFRGRLISGVFAMLSLLGSPLVAGELWIGAASAGHHAEPARGFGRPV